ncbi:MAG: T9SS type A sorting domain-containing protein [Saprospiraceae bacterium]|nr:T9SS type A sorting domain-containing protein [Saprospiraceae bacterium]
MKQILLIIFLFSTPGWINAQKSFISIQPTKVDTLVQMNLSKTATEITLSVNVRNNTSDTLFLRWERNVVNMPKSWASRICDDNFCYPQMVYSNVDESLFLNEPWQILPRKSNKLQLHILPSGLPGVGKIELEIASVKQPNIVIGVATFNIEVIGMGTNYGSRKPLKVYPNPSGNYLTLSDAEGIERMSVYNMVGREVKTFQVEDNAVYDIGNLTDGIYLVGLFDKKGNLVKTIRVSKRPVRP